MSSHNSYAVKSAVASFEEGARHIGVVRSISPEFLMNGMGWRFSRH
jgi:hypothetical protein